MNRITWSAAALFVALTTSAAANLNDLVTRIPAIASAAIDPENPDRVLIHLNWALHEAGLSTDAGETFAPVTNPEEVSDTDWTSTLSAGSRRYALVDAGRSSLANWGRQLLRSNDGGTTWTATGAYRFLMDQGKEKASELEEHYRARYGHRLPHRSPLWHGAFALFALTHLTALGALSPSKGWWWKTATFLRSLLLLFLVWSFLVSFHAFITGMLELFYPMDFYSSSTVSAMAPTFKLGVAMHIAARPWALLAYLIVLWPLLPGTLEVLTRWLSPERRNTSLAITVTAGLLFLLFHVLLLAVGYFWEPDYY